MIRLEEGNALSNCYDNVVRVVVTKKIDHVICHFKERIGGRIKGRRVRLVLSDAIFVLAYFSKQYWYILLYMGLLFDR